VTMSSLHAQIYKENFQVHAHNFKELAKKWYIWIDWISMPQPTAERNLVKAQKMRESAKGS